MTIRRTNIRTKVKQEQAAAVEEALAQQAAQSDTPAEQSAPTREPASAVQVPVEPAELSQEPEPPTDLDIVPERVAKEIVLPAPRPARRVKRRVPFDEQHVKRTLSVDRRLVAAFDDLMGSGGNKTVMANQWILKTLLDAGYQIDPDILTQPFIKPRKRS